jgi:hypothetical protein
VGLSERPIALGLMVLTPIKDKVNTLRSNQRERFIAIFVKIEQVGIIWTANITKPYDLALFRGGALQS